MFISNWYVPITNISLLSFSIIKIGDITVATNTKPSHIKCRSKDEVHTNEDQTCTLCDDDWDGMSSNEEDMLVAEGEPTNKVSCFKKLCDDLFSTDNEGSEHYMDQGKNVV